MLWSATLLKKPSESQKHISFKKLNEFGAVFLWGNIFTMDWYNLLYNPCALVRIYLLSPGNSDDSEAIALFQKLDSRKSPSSLEKNRKNLANIVLMISFVLLKLLLKNFIIWFCDWKTIMARVLRLADSSLSVFQQFSSVFRIRIRIMGGVLDPDMHGGVRIWIQEVKKQKENRFMSWKSKARI